MQEIRYHRCSKIMQANEYSSNIDIEIYEAGNTWYYRIDDNDEVKEQAVEYCPYCGVDLEKQ